MSHKTTILLLILSFFLLYAGAIPKDDKCDIFLNTIDYSVSGADGQSQMLNGTMSKMSYFRQQLAKKLKDLYDNSDC